VWIGFGRIDFRDRYDKRHFPLAVTDQGNDFARLRHHTVVSRNDQHNYVCHGSTSTAHR
jgi:hypothetical protein